MVLTYQNKPRIKLKKNKRKRIFKKKETKIDWVNILLIIIVLGLTILYAIR